MKSRSLPFFVLLALGLSLALRGYAGAFSFPETPRGRRAAAYFAAFNASGEKAMAEFLKKNFSADALQRASIEERLARFRGFRRQAAALSPEKLIRDSGEAVAFVVKDGRGGWFEFIFNFEKGRNGKIISILNAPVSPDDVADLSGPPLSREEALARVRAVLDERSRGDLFSGVVLLAEGEKIILHEARGLASVEYGAANRPDTRFNLGSINKIFTRLAIGQLIEKGKVSLADRIGRFLPDFPNREAAEKVTIGQLLDMTSGIGDFFGQRFADTPKDRIRSLADYLPLFAAEPLLFAPGSQRRYSNGGYVVLGLIVEKASGMSYFDYVREHIYAPAGMTATGHFEADVPEPNVASGYTRNWDDGSHEKEARRSNIHTRPARGSSAGGGYSTAMDLFRFARALRAGLLLGPLAKDWFGGPQAYAGGAPGINAAIEMDPVPGWTVIVLGNYDPPAAMDLAGKISILLRRLR
jgi:CubicO group peptidase (beta-lactamase class C family)